MWNKFIVKTKSVLYPLYAFKELLFKKRINKKVEPKSTNKNFKIPLIVHQIWINNVFPKTIGNQIKKFRSLNSDVEFNLYSHRDVNNFMKKFYKNHKIYKIFRNARYWQLKADIFRYCFVLEKGGFWFDIKSMLDIPLCKILKKDADMVISYGKDDDPTMKNNKKVFSKLLHRNKYIETWGFASVKGNYILKKVIKCICDHYPNYKNKIFENPKVAILEFSGARLFSKVLRNELSKKRKSIKIQQAGIDFNGRGIYFARGGLMLHYRKSHYSSHKFRKILS